jgi:hypothetical protein
VRCSYFFRVRQERRLSPYMDTWNVCCHYVEQTSERKFVDLYLVVKSMAYLKKKWMVKEHICVYILQQLMVILLLCFYKTKCL